MICLALLVLILISALSINAFAFKQDIVFSVNPSVNNGYQFVGANTKDDNEQCAYYVTSTSHNITSNSRFYYRTWRGPSIAYAAVNGNVRCYGNGTLTSGYYASQYCGKGTGLYLSGKTDVDYVYVTGYWYS